MTAIQAWVARAGRAASAFALFAALGTTAKAQGLVKFGDHITEPGVYFLHGNQSGTGHGIVIDSDDVALFMSRFTLRNVPPPPPLNGDASVGFSFGILIQNRDNVSIFGGRITNFDAGIVMLQCENFTLKDTRIDHSMFSGIDGFDVDHSSFVRVRTDHNGQDGIRLANASYNRFFSVRSDENGSNGIELLGEQIPGVTEGSAASENTFRKCWLAYNIANGLRLVDADDNTIDENQCVANHGSGILLTSAFPNVASEVAQDGPGSDENRVTKNWCPANGHGIAVSVESTDNHLEKNIALASFVFDAFDGNDPPPCANTWILNTVLTRGGDGAFCIF